MSSGIPNTEDKTGNKKGNKKIHSSFFFKDKTGFYYLGMHT
jgi:hypothetical protein